MGLTLSKKNIKQVYIKALFYAFFLYGILYFLNPESTYDDSSKIKYIRFIIVVLLWIVLFKKSNAKVIVKYFLGSLVLTADAYFAGWNGAFDLINVINFLMPVSCYFLYKNLDKTTLIRIIKIVYLISSLFTYVECFLLRGVYTQFSYSGYRAASIFNSPNTYGCFLVLMSCILLYDPDTKMTYKIVAFFNSMLMAYLTGSRACFLILVISYFIIFAQWVFKTKRIKRKSFKYIIVGAIIVIIGLSFFGDKISSLSTRSVWSYDLSRLLSLSKDTRTVYNSQFMEAARHDPLFPWFNELIYVDNMYLFIWGRFGLHILVLYLILLGKIGYEIIRKKQKENFCLFICFVMFGMVLNYMYLWPNSFVFWFFVGDVLTKNKRTLNIYEREICKY